MIDKLFEKLTWAIERVLALAFIFAVGLNFANVIGRYVLDRSLLGADEVQIYIMVCMAFLGAAVVAWRKQHLRMDVLLQYFPGRLRRLLRAAEAVLVAVLAGFVLFHSSSYAWQMLTLDRKSDNASIPMWIPHSAVALGFGLIALIALWRGAQWIRGHGQPAAAEESAKTGQII